MVLGRGDSLACCDLVAHGSLGSSRVSKYRLRAASCHLRETCCDSGGVVCR